jgi:hypothetical protein
VRRNSRIDAEFEQSVQAAAAEGESVSSHCGGKKTIIKKEYDRPHFQPETI